MNHFPNQANTPNSATTENPPVPHTLAEFLHLLGDLVVEHHTSPQQEIHHISYNSSQVTPPCLFICKGVHFSPSYLEEAKEKGAVCYIADQKYPVDMDYILVSDLRLALGKAVAFYFGPVSEHLSLIGITGTKGKSTTALFVRSILDAMERRNGSEKKSAILCSILTYDGKEELPSRLTTKEPIELYQHIQNAIHCDLSHLTMEVSSQAVKYHRIYGLDFALGCYLNIGEDHISPNEHPDFEDYFSSKLAFFSRCRTLCVNLDGVCTHRVLQAVPETTRLLTCSRQDPSADYYVSCCEKKGISSHFTVVSPHFPTGQAEFSISMAGLFNIDNALCAIALCLQLGAREEDIREGLRLGRSPGRMELYASEDEKVTLLVDYAHNKMSFQALFHSMKEEFPHKKLIAVFGCPGEKALDRRKDMGSIADQFADFTILTEDDPANEKIQDICNEIARHMPKGKYSIQVDRPQAVQDAIALFPNQEILVLLLGKGTETDQKRGSSYETMPTDGETALDCLALYNKTHPKK